MALQRHSWLFLGYLLGSPVVLADMIELPKMTITAKGYASQDQSTPQAIEVLAPQTVDSLDPAGSLFRGKPGLAVHSDGAWGQNPVLRGLKKESTVLMVDGIRVNSAQPQGSLASFLDLGLLDRAEVVKGPGSVLYGSGAMGGVVNLITPSASFTDESQTHGRFGVGLSSVNDGFSGAVLLRDSSPDHALVLGAAGRKVQDYDGPDGKQDHTGYGSNSLLFKYKHRLTETANVNVNIQRHSDRDVWYPGSTRNGARPGGAGLPLPLGDVTIRSPNQHRELYQFGLENALGAGTLNTELYRQEVYREIRAYAKNLDRSYVRNDVSFITHGLRTAWRLPVDNHFITVGAEGWRMTGDPERYMDNNAPHFNNNVRNDPFKDGVLESYGVFLQDEFDWRDTLFVLGIRLDHVSGEADQKGTQKQGLKNADNNLSWSIGATRPLTETLNAYLNIGQAYRAPDLRERFEDAARGDGYYHVGNPKLDPERSTSFEVGIKGGDDLFEYRAALFHTRIDDYIAGRVTGASNPQNGLPIKRTENLDKVEIYGLEGMASVKLGSFLIDGTFTWMRGENRQDNEPLYQMPANELTLGIGQPAEKGFYWHTRLRAVAKQNRIAKRFSAGSEDATAGFVTADANLGWRFGKAGLLDDLTLEAQLTNLFDKRYHEHLADGLAGYELDAPGRGVTFAVSGSF